MKTKYLELRGILTCTPEGSGKPFGKYVFQKTAAGHGNVPGDPTARQQVRLWVRGTLTNTQAQWIHRARFALGIGTWQAMTEEEKEAWRAPSAALGLNRFQGFMREWMREWNSSKFTGWDDAATTWDAGATTWPLPEGTVFDSGRSQWDSGSTYFDV